MQMLAPQAVVARTTWMTIRAGLSVARAPMQVEAVDQQSYSLTLGRFGNFGFEVEPTIGLRLLPDSAGRDVQD